MVYLFLTTRFGPGIRSIILTVLCIVCIVLIVFYSFYKCVYNFGPKHCKWSLMDKLLNPVPGIEFIGQIGKSSDYDSFKHCRFNHNTIGRRLWCNKVLSSKVITQNITSVVYDCPSTYLPITNPRPHGYRTYLFLTNWHLMRGIF